MAEMVDLGPLQMACEGDRYRFSLTQTERLGPELPADFEQQLAERLAQALPAGRPLRLLLDLQNVPGLSSPQLGIMLALHKTLRNYGPRLPVVNASQRVRRLLEVTHTEQFFELV